MGYNISTVRDDKLNGRKEKHMEDMGMTDKQFKFFLKRLSKDIEDIKEDIKEDNKEKAIEKIESLKEDIKTTIED